MTTPTFVLASASPRRAELLARAGLRPAVIPADVDESVLPGESPQQMVERLSLAKARAVLAGLTGAHLVLAADTIVVRDDVILGKPADEAEARSMLRSLSGREHQVKTGFALVRDDGRQIVCTVSTDVVFRALSEEVIQRYVATGEPMGKAGSYGIQGVAAMLVERISGSYTNVVGLPLVEVIERLPELGGPRL